MPARKRTTEELDHTAVEQPGTAQVDSPGEIEMTTREKRAAEKRAKEREADESRLADEKKQAEAALRQKNQEGDVAAFLPRKAAPAFTFPTEKIAQVTDDQLRKIQDEGRLVGYDPDTRTATVRVR